MTTQPNEVYLALEIAKGWACFLECIHQRKRDIHILLPSDEAVTILKKRLQNYPDLQIHYHTPLGWLEFSLKINNRQKTLLPSSIARILCYEGKQISRLSDAITDDEILELYSKHAELQDLKCTEKYLFPHQILGLLNAEKDWKLFDFGIVYGFGAFNGKDAYVGAFLKFFKNSCLFAFAPTSQSWLQRFSNSVQILGSASKNTCDLTVWSAKNPVQESRFVADKMDERSALVLPPKPEYAHCLSQFLLKGAVDADSEEKTLMINAWVEWQKRNSLEAFSDWLNQLKICDRLGSEEKNLIKKRFVEAFNTCMTDNFSVLHRFVGEKLQTHEPSLHTLVVWPDKAEWDVFIDLALQHLPKNLSAYVQTLLKGYELSGLTIEKETFFAVLQWLLRENLPFRGISLETASIFPWETVFIPFLNQQKINKEIFDVLHHSGAKLYLSFHEDDVEENKLSECCWIKESFICKEIILRSILPGEPKIFRNENCRILMDLPQAATFPCKTWERFVQDPERAWLEDVLKVRAEDFCTFAVRSRMVGEWVHDHLSFVIPPKKKEDWLKAVREKAFNLRNRVNLAYGKTPYVWLQTWERALSIAECMASAYGEFDAAYHYSEQLLPKTDIVLPQTKEHITTYGRVDWLISTVAFEKECHAVPSIAEIIDFKTSEKFSFMPSQRAKGVGLQLVLYGLILENMGYSDIQLSMIYPDGEKSACALSAAKEELSEIWEKLSVISQNKRLEFSSQSKYGEDKHRPVSTLKSNW